MTRPGAAGDVPFLDRARETAPPETLRDWQWQRLTQGLGEVWGSNAFWRARLQAAGLGDPRDLGSWADFPRLPRLTKADLVADQTAHPPLGTNLTHPIERYVRVFQTSGTTGRPIRWLETEASWAWWARCWAFVFRAAGLAPERPALLSVLLRPVRRLLGRTGGGADPRRDGHPGRRPGLGDPAPHDPGPRGDRPRLHAVVRAPPRRGRPRARASTRRRSASGRRSTRGSQGPASPPCGSASRRCGTPGLTTTRA